MSGRFKFFPFGFREFTGEGINDGLQWAAWNFQVAACSDETTPIVAASGLITFRLPELLLDDTPRASLTTASSSGPVTVDIQANGVSVLTAPIRILQGAKTSVGGGGGVLRKTQLLLPDDVEITVQCVAAGTNAAGLKVTLLGRRQTR